MTFRGSPDGEALYMFRSYDHFSDNSGWVISPGPANLVQTPITIGEFIYQDAGIGRKLGTTQAYKLYLR